MTPRFDLSLALLVSNIGCHLYLLVHVRHIFMANRFLGRDGDAIPMRRSQPPPQIRPVRLLQAQSSPFMTIPALPSTSTDHKSPPTTGYDCLFVCNTALDCPFLPIVAQIGCTCSLSTSKGKIEAYKRTYMHPQRCIPSFSLGGCRVSLVASRY